MRILTPPTTPVTSPAAGIMTIRGRYGPVLAPAVAPRPSSTVHQVAARIAWAAAARNWAALSPTTQQQWRDQYGDMFWPPWMQFAAAWHLSAPGYPVPYPQPGPVYPTPPIDCRIDGDFQLSMYFPDPPAGTFGGRCMIGWHAGSRPTSRSRCWRTGMVPHVFAGSGWHGVSVLPGRFPPGPIWGLATTWGSFTLPLYTVLLAARM